MVKKKKRINIPTRFIEVDKEYRTKYLQHGPSGQLRGRQGRAKGHLPKLVVAKIDRSPAASNVRRVKTKKGIYKEHIGEIFGRQSWVKKHKRISKKGKKHSVNEYQRKR